MPAALPVSTTEPAELLQVVLTMVPTVKDGAALTVRSM